MTDSRKGYVRMRTLQAVVLLIFGVIILRLAYIQLIDPKYEKLARGNALRHVVQYPPRGEIFDRNGEYLAQNRVCYDLMVIYRELPREGFDTLQMLDLLGISRTKLERALRNARMSPRIPYMVTNFISSEVKLRFDENDFPGFYTVYRTIRSYPRKIGGNLLGDVGEINERQLKMKRYADYRSGDYVGQSGVEKAYEEELRGKKGVKIMEKDTHGVVKGSYMDGMFDSLPEPGNYIVTTIDARLQAFTEELMRGKVGAAVAIEPSTGEILMMVSSPTYDPDELVGRERGNHYMELLRNKRQPLYNRAVQSKFYPPGSTFKVLSAIAGLEEGIIDANTQITCTGVFEYGGQKFTCKNHDTPMTLDVTGALKYSCNTFFYTVGQKLTGEHLEKWSERFGLGVVTGIGIGERSGHAAGPTYRAEMKKADPSTRGWQGGDDVIAAIGQSDNGFTPPQLANYISAVVNGGTLYQPTLVRNIKSYDFSSVVKSETPNVKEKIEISDETRRLVMQGMSEVTDEGGTAGSVFADYPIKVGGKTGTAETYENGEAFDNGLFIAFAPFDDPQIVICVVGEGAGHGAYVAPVVRDMLDEFFTADDVENVDAVPKENTLLR